MEWWNVRAGTRLTFEATPEAARLPVYFDDGIPLVFGIYDKLSGEIFINSYLDEEHARAVVIAHEIGHAFGLPHIEAEERHSLMNPGNRVTEVTDGDLSALEALWGSCGAPADLL